MSGRDEWARREAEAREALERSDERSKRAAAEPGDVLEAVDESRDRIPSATPPKALERVTTRRPDRRPLLSTREVAELLGIRPETVLRWTEAGKLRGLRISTRALRFDPDDVDAFLAGVATGAVEREDECQGA